MIALLRLVTRLSSGRTLLLALGAFLLFTCTVHAQSAADPRSPVAGAAQSTNGPGFAETAPPDPSRTDMLRNMARERNELRQKAIVDDTTRLLALAQQLKTAVDKSSKDQLSLSVVNTASEIEKLAKTVKDRMRDGN